MAVRKSKADVRVCVETDRLRIYLFGLLHLSLDLSELVAVQSWKFGEERFDIEYTLRTTSIQTWYDQRYLWEAVLSGLSKIGRI